MFENKQRLESMQQLYDAQLKHCKQYLENLREYIFKKYPELDSVIWVQYRQIFNYGDPCKFYVNSQDPFIYFKKDYVYSEYEGLCIESEYITENNKDLLSDPITMEEVRITKEIHKEVGELLSPKILKNTLKKLFKQGIVVMTKDNIKAHENTYKNIAIWRYLEY